MADKYELTVDGLQTSDLTPIKDALGKMVLENGNYTANDNGVRQEYERQQMLKRLEEGGASPQEIMEGLAAALGGLMRSPEDDVRELSRQFPTNIFYLLCVSEMEEYGEIDTLENFHRLRIQDGQLTGIYDAEPVVWTSRFGY